MSYELVIVDRDESDRSPNALLRRPGKILIVVYNEEQDRWDVIDVPWQAAGALAPERLKLALEAWRLQHPIQAKAVD